MLYWYHKKIEYFFCLYSRYKRNKTELETELETDRKTTIMSSNMLTAEEFMTKCGMSEEMAIQMVKAQKKVAEDIKQQKFNQWKTQTNYDEFVSEWNILQEKAEQAKKKIPKQEKKQALLLSFRLFLCYVPSFL